MFPIDDEQGRTRNARRPFGHVVSRPLRCEALEEKTLLAGVSFDIAARIPMGEQTTFVEAADLDKDGDQDLVVLHYSDAGFSVFLNDGTGDFGQEHRFETGRNPWKAAIADFTGDQILDLGIRTFNRGSVISIYRGVGDGTFERMDDYATKGSSSAYIVAGDWDGDGDMDLATANQYTHDISVLLGHGDGTFENPVRYASEGQGTTGITAGDFDEDGDMDLAAANYFSRGDRTVSVFLGEGDGLGTFAPAETYDSGANSWALDNADVNRDGHLDLVVSTIHGPSILLGNGDGTFETANLYATFQASFPWAPNFDDPELQPFGFDLGDLNGDGVLDLVLGNWIGWYKDTGVEFGRLSVMLGVGDGTFEEPSVIDIGGWPRTVTAADLDGDGDLDLATVGFESMPLTLLFNERQTAIAPGDANHDSRFDQRDIVQVLQAAKYLTGQPATFEEGDWNGDGIFDQLDIIAALTSGRYLAPFSSVKCVS